MVNSKFIEIQVVNKRLYMGPIVRRLFEKKLFLKVTDKLFPFRVLVIVDNVAVYLYIKLDMSQMA